MKKYRVNHTAIISTILGILACLTLVFIVAQQCWRIHWFLGTVVTICELGFVLGTAYACMICPTLLMDESAEDETEEL